MITHCGSSSRNLTFTFFDMSAQRHRICPHQTSLENEWIGGGGLTTKCAKHFRNVARAEEMEMDGRRRHHSAFGMSIDARVGVALWENVADFSTPPSLHRSNGRTTKNIKIGHITPILCFPRGWMFGLHDQSPYSPHCQSDSRQNTPLINRPLL